jgi:hypothetical protein
MTDLSRNNARALDEALTNDLALRYCPICLILEEKTRDLLCELQYDAVHKHEVKKLVLEAGGYCHFHFWYLEKLTSSTTNAQLLEHLLKKIRINFPDYQDTPGDPDRLLPNIRCPVCSSCRTWENDLVVLFTAKIGEADFQSRYYDSRGLCLPHLVEVLRGISDAKAVMSLLAASARQLDTLIQELRLHVAKWHAKDRSRGEEQDSTYRAIQKLVGGKNYRTG